MRKVCDANASVFRTGESSRGRSSEKSRISLGLCFRPSVSLRHDNLHCILCKSSRRTAVCTRARMRVATRLGQKLRSVLRTCAMAVDILVLDASNKRN